MKISEEQYLKLPDEYKKYFTKNGGDANSDEHKRNVHPT